MRAEQCSEVKKERTKQMILRLTMEVKDEVHQNEVLNRVEATGAQLSEVEVVSSPLISVEEYQRQVRDQAEKGMTVCMPDQPEMVEHMPFLTYLAQYCTNILEIGCGHGNGSTRAFERGLKSIENPKCLLKHITVDIDPERPQAKPSITPFYYYKAVSGDSREALTYKTVLRHSPFDLIYIDTDHTYEVMQAELSTLHAEGLIHDDVLLVFHDTWMFGAYNRMTDAIKEFAQSLDWVFNDYTKVSHGLGLMYKPGGGWQRLIEESTPKAYFYPNES